MELNKKDLFAIPNILSILRILMLIPLFILLRLEMNNWFLLLAAIAMFTDFLDGFIARKFNQITELGKILDPVADKLNTAVIIIALYIYQDFPFWIMVIIIGRDLLILLGATFIFKRQNQITTSNIPGKIAVFFIAFAVLMFIAHFKIYFVYSLYIALFFILLSFTSYAMKFIKYLYGNKWNDQ